MRKRERENKAYFQALPKRFTEVLSDLVDTDTSHGPDSERTNQRVRVLTVLGEGVDSQDG